MSHKKELVPVQEKQEKSVLRKFFGRDKNDSHEFKPLLAEIEENPGSRVGRVIFWTIVAVMVFTVIWMYVGEIDVVISARGKVIPDGEIKILQPLDYGVVSKILVKEGDQVKKDQVMMEIDPSTIAPELESMKTNLKRLELEIIRYESILEERLFKPDITMYENELVKIQRDIYHSMLMGLENQLRIKNEVIKELEKETSVLETEMNRSRSLLAISTEKKNRLETVIDIIAKNEYEDALNEVLNYENNITRSGFKLKEIDHRKKQIVEEIAYLKEDFRTTILKELSVIQKQVSISRAEIEKMSFKNSRQKIVAPVNGYVNKLLIHTVGGVVSPAQNLVAIVPDDTPLVIKAVLANKDRGFVKKGMPVTVKIDTFDFQKYGSVDGEVDHVAKDSIEKEGQDIIFEVYIKMLDKFLIVEGKEVPVSSGMSLTAEIKVEKRKIIEFFIYPIVKYLDEGVSVR